MKPNDSGYSRAPPYPLSPTLASLIEPLRKRVQNTVQFVNFRNIMIALRKSHHLCILMCVTD
jgi:hypothetical protein